MRKINIMNAIMASKVESVVAFITAIVVVLLAQSNQYCSSRAVKGAKAFSLMSDGWC